MNMKMRKANRYYTALLLLSVSVPALAQDATSAVNDFLSEWLKPLFLGLIVLVIVVGLVVEADNLVDKNGQGTRKQALINIGMYVVYAVLATLVIGGAISAIQDVDLSI